VGQVFNPPVSGFSSPEESGDGKVAHIRRQEYPDAPRVLKFIKKLVAPSDFTAILSVPLAKPQRRSN